MDKKIDLRVVEKKDDFTWHVFILAGGYLRIYYTYTLFNNVFDVISLTSQVLLHWFILPL